MMFAQWPSWLSRSPSVRRPVIRLWRVLLRAQRATVANAVLVVRRPDGCILALALPSGELRLPDKQLDAWVPIDTQVEEWLEQLLESSCAPSLVAVDGTPGRKGVTFLYVADAGASASDQGKGTWLDPDVALGTVPADDRRLLILSKC
jgi:hypothetical protein